MSSSIPIPSSRTNKHPRNPSISTSTSYSQHYATTPESSYSLSSSLVTGKGKGKGKEREVEVGVAQPRRASLLGSSLSKSEHTVVDLGGGRLVSSSTCLGG
jgi:hypothetical protein